MRLLPLFVLVAVACGAQDFVQRGFIDYRSWVYPQEAPNDSGNLVLEGLFRYEFERVLFGNWRITGATDTRLDSHHQVDRRFYVNWSDREAQRPAFSIRRATLVYNKGRFTAEIGKQPVRWGKADILNPTDRFAPRDFLAVVDNEFLNVGAARAIYEGQSNSLEVVVQPRFTPSRTPLLNQRWTVIPDQFQRIPLRDGGSRVPSRPAYGLRWNHLGSGYEASVSVYDGFNHLPLLESSLDPTGINVVRTYPRLRSFGADAAVPLRWFAVKGEGTLFTSPDKRADDYVIYVLQLERQIGELSIVGGYAGEWVAKKRSDLQFAPDRGLAKAFLGRATYTLDPRRSLAIEYAVRENGDGYWIRSEFSRSIGKNWRAIGGYTAIGGNRTDFLGQYRRNSHVHFVLRCSF